MRPRISSFLIAAMTAVACAKDPAPKAAPLAAGPAQTLEFAKPAPAEPAYVAPKDEPAMPSLAFASEKDQAAYDAVQKQVLAVRAQEDGLCPPGKDFARCAQNHLDALEILDRMMAALRGSCLASVSATPDAEATGRLRDLVARNLSSPSCIAELQSSQGQIIAVE